jgi:hypothetical protein
MKGQPITQRWANDLRESVYRLAAKKETQWKSIPQIDSQPPFFPTLYVVDDGGSPAYKLLMKKGWVSSTHQKHAVNSVVTIEVTSIPGDPDPVTNALTVADGTKIYCTLTENVYGEVTAAAISSGTSWPDSDAPEYIGGDDQAGSGGTRYVRLCEIVTVDGSVKVKVIHTGNIEHTAPPLVENTVTSVSSDEARVYKGYNSAQGRHELRYLEAGAGINITEGVGKITVAADTSSNPYSHPWKVTDGGSGNAAIAAGFINGYYLPFAGFSDVFDGGFEGPDSIVAGPSAKYSGGTAAITGTQYIYALIPRSFPDALYGGNQDVENPSDSGFTGGQEIHNHNALDPGGFTTGAPTDTATIAVSSDTPDVYDPGEDSAARCIAKVTNTAGTITIDAQYITHNPDMFVPLVKGVWAYYTP